MTAPRRSPRSLRAAVLATLLLSLCSCDDLRDPAVVTIGSDIYTLSDLRREYADLAPNVRPPLGVRESRRTFVDRLIERRLLAEYGDSLLAANARFDDEWENDQDEILLRRLRVVVGVGELPGPDEIDAAIARAAMRTRIERLQFPDEASAVEAREKVLAGQSFAEAATGPGVLTSEQWIEWKPMAGELADRASALEVGAVSEIFRWNSVDQIIRAVERVPLEVPPSAQFATGVSSGLRLRRAADRMSALADELQNAADVRIDEAAVARLAESTATVILGGAITQHERDWALPDVVDGLVAEWEGGQLTNGDYVRALRFEIPAQRPSGGFLARKVLAAVESQVRSRVLLDEARRRGLDEDWWVERAVRKARENFEIRIAEDRIRDGIRVEPAVVDSVEAFLRSMPIEMFRHEERARVLRFDFQSRSAALRELERIRAAGGGVARLRSLMRGDPAFHGTINLLSMTAAGLAHPEIAAFVLDPAAPRVSGPFDLAGRWVIFDRLALEPSRPMSDEEVRTTIADRIRTERATATKMAWLDQRRRERAVTVDEDLLDELSPGG